MKKKKSSPYFIAALLILAGIVAYLFSKSNVVEIPAEKISQSAPQIQTPQTLPENKPLRRGEIKARSVNPHPELPLFALPNERIARFANEEDYRAFLASMAARGLKLLGSSDSLRAVRFGLGSDSDFSNINGAELFYNYLVTLPTPSTASAQDGALGFGSQSLAWLGVTGDNSSWGQGIFIAVIDSGVNNHLALSGSGALSFINLTELANGADQLGHGTAVASIISGDHSLTPGVAPSSDILSIRVTDEFGNSDSFTLAEAIMQAVNSGVDLINISMGSAVNSTLVQEAVNYALENGIIIVASSGNEGAENALFPADNEGVISTGAIEAEGEHLDFSSSDEDLNITAPGYGVNAAWGDELLISFSGTSASAPFVTGAIAAAMSEYDLSATDAANLVLSVTNDAGLPGDDNDYGAGILDIGRIMTINTAGVYDIAVAGQVLSPDSTSEAWVTIQNQGTETLINSDVTVTTSTGTQRYNISSLAVGEIHTYTLPIVLPSNGDTISIETTVNITETEIDTGNNSKTTELQVE
ncbi:MAG: S8 family peptidase [Akkermansiaceae bacterium]